ncbi:hypothetical protein [Sphingosinicella terrae]|uniref:hypothetical protein n=1 Tax=Sphingosinicella terrae TaxID=2172047 RepID=UPI000E0D7769|nr:hypothetical protein [Sphingosinicella terrae]
MARSTRAAARADGSDAVAVTVRMYKGILGDCFLLRFTRGERTSRVLIDCGIIQGVAGAKGRMQEIAADIVAQCGGDVAEGRAGHLDLLVVTHEHWDHISGFGQAAEIFIGEDGGQPLLEIGRLWMAWTEDPEDDLAAELRGRFDRRKKAVAMMGLAAAGAVNAFAAAPAEAATGLEAFVGPLDEAGALGFGSKLTGRAIMAKLQEVASATDYLRPGQVVETPGEVAIRTFVLGPPRSKDRLFKDSPSAGDRKETYLDEPDVCEGPILALAEKGNEADLSAFSPFAPRHRRLTRREVERCNAARGDRASEAPDVFGWLQRHYFDPRPGCRYEANRPKDHDCRKDLFCSLDQGQRRIDNDWMQAAGALALKLDSDTNNTSLVLAFELPGGEVLLFAADAQVGNWLSWHDQTYAAAGGEVTAEALLGRTILYKVGHHGSHNATLDEKGLRMMRDPRLTAMIPVVEAVAKKQPGHGWKMPFPDLKSELLVRTSGRILRGDCAAGRDLDHGEDRDLKPGREFLDRVADPDHQLWVEYRVSG